MIGLIAVADAPRPTAKAAVARLRERGVQVAMLTGDNAGTARRIAGELGIDPLDVLVAIELSRATLRKMHQNLTWAVLYNVIAFPLAAAVLYPRTLSPEIAALSMSGSTVLVARVRNEVLCSLTYRRSVMRRRSFAATRWTAMVSAAQQIAAATGGGDARPVSRGPRRSG